MNLISALVRKAYMPLCRAYSRCIVGNKPADAVMTWLTSLHFWRVHGYWPKLKAPRSFEEKINARMLFDRDPRWALLSDKIQVRNYVAERVGRDVLIPLLWTGRRPQDIPLNELPAQFVIKANHGCGYTMIVKEKSQFDLASVRGKLEKWLSENFCHDYVLGTAWAYRNICPSLMVESFIDDHGEAPLDYKFFCFGGKVEVFKLDFDRFTDHSVLFFDRECRPHEVHEKGLKRYQGEVELPNNIHEMIEIAECLAEGMDFIRVDLYNVDGRIYFGELTCYPSGGAGPWVPESYDFLWGLKWKLAPFVAAPSRA